MVEIDIFKNKAALFHAELRILFITLTVMKILKQNLRSEDLHRNSVTAQ